MYLGRIVEQGPADQLLADPRHPYTQSLAAAIAADPRNPVRRRRGVVRGETPSPSEPPPGCHFHPRCPHAFDPCTSLTPEPVPAGPGRTASCHLLGEAHRG
jgi:oligopeptide/dipeptide ABC transporter ATP-binding protein